MITVLRLTVSFVLSNSLKLYFWVIFDAHWPEKGAATFASNFAKF